MTNTKPTGNSTVSFNAIQPTQTLNILENDLLQGFSDADGDVLNVFALDANNGQLSETGKGAWIFTPEPNFSGNVTLDYTVSDGKSGFVNGAVNFSIIGQSASEKIFDAVGYYRFFAMLSSAVYLHTGVGDEPEPTEHRAFELDNYQRIVATSGFHFLTANELGIAQTGTAQATWSDTDPYSSLIGNEKTYQYDFKNGFYGTDLDYSPASAFALVGATNDALFVTFRGTDQNWDWVTDGVGMHQQYAMYSALTKAIDSYLIKNPSMKVYVSGHSLGGQMATLYMSEHFGDERFTAVEFEAANKLWSDNQGKSLPSKNPNIVNVEMPYDPVADLGVNRGDVIQVEFKDKNGRDYTHGTASDHPMSEVFKYIGEIDKQVDRNPTADVTLNLYDRAVALGNGNTDNMMIEAQKAMYVSSASLKGSDTVVIKGSDGETYRAFNNLTFNNPIVKKIIIEDDTYSPSENINYSADVKDTNGKVIIGNTGNNSLSGGAGADNLQGGKGADTLSGMKGKDTLFGEEGNDTLVGGEGNDQLSGGLGADIFKFESIADTGANRATQDIIKDFRRYEGDKIDLSKIDANNSTKKDDPFLTLDSGIDDRIFTLTNALYFNTKSHVLYGNNDGDKEADFSIFLSGITDVTQPEV